jgi:hypothetical protein
MVTQALTQTALGPWSAANVTDLALEIVDNVDASFLGGFKFPVLFGESMALLMHQTGEQALYFFWFADAHIHPFVPRGAKPVKTLVAPSI